ncbi:hypothetical protein F66182_9557 [Fusarium sp. NRRL 66182]|nr:hypothetical protein F66182_9557 [Fusarium sp. NRRL 66182]
MLPYLGSGPSPSGKRCDQYDPVVNDLVDFLEANQPCALDKAVQEAYHKIPWFMDKFNIRDSHAFLVFASSLLRWTPTENREAKDIVDILCMFYFVLDQPPLLGLQSPMTPKQAGQPLTWLSAWMVNYSRHIGLFMDSPESITTESLEGFKRSPKYNWEEAEIPEDGFKTFNEFFYRRLKPGARPIASPDDDRVIVYPADCTYDNSIPNQSIVDISGDGVIYVKNLPWTIGTLLQESQYAASFHGGVWMHAFLNVFNYHRVHAPVSGKVLEVKNIHGTVYLEVGTNFDPVSSTHAPDIPNRPGYQFLQARGMVILENAVVGKVAVLPIGMAHVSSVSLTINEGQVLDKGEEIGYFQFGGSDVVCVFQSRAGLKPKDFVPSNSTYSKMGTILARAEGLSGEL